MKRKNYIKIWLLSAVIAGLGAFTSCDNAEYDVLDTHAFIKEALSGTSSKVNVSVDGESKTTLNIHLSDLSTTDNHYKLVVDPSVLDEFNRQNGTSYITLPKGQYILPEDILVKAGEYNAEETEITLEAFSDEMMKSGESYALPLRLVAKDGALPAMDNTGSFVILAESTIRFSAPMFVGGAKLFSQSYIDNPETYAQYTIEVRFQVSDTDNRNRAVFSTDDGGSDKKRYILLRFEDPNAENPDHPLHSLVQIQLHDGMYVNPSHHFEVNKWQHLAVTFDGMNYKIYVNGVDSGTLACSDPCRTFTSINWFTDGDGNQSGWWGSCKILVCEARIWSVARSAVQIQNSMVQVSPSSEGLEAYWRLNEGEGKNFVDATGHNHSLTTSKDVVWVHDILSTDESTAWPE